MPVLPRPVENANLSDACAAGQLVEALAAVENVVAPAAEQLVGRPLPPTRVLLPDIAVDLVGEAVARTVDVGQCPAASCSRYSSPACS